MVGIGLTAGDANTNFSKTMMSAWERWYLDYITPIEPNSQDGIYTLGDYVSTGDAIRIDIPFSNMNSGGGEEQRLWIQNNAGGHDFYTHRYSGENLTRWSAPSEDPDHLVTDSDDGIYMYTENIAGSHEETGIVFSGGGQLRMINPMGNWDVTRLTEESTTFNLFQATMYPFRYEEENPISGINPWFAYRGDHGSPGDDCQDDEILYCGNTIGGGCNVNDLPNNACVNNMRNEFDLIRREEINGVFDHTYRSFGVNGGADVIPLPSTAFEAGDELSMGTNPTIINMAEYNAGTEQNAPYYLNGLSVKIISSGPQAQVEVKYKQTGVNEDVRWTGDVILPDITENGAYDLNLAPDKKITIDVSGSAHRSTRHPATNDFVNPSSFTISSGAKILLRESSQLLVKENSTLIIEAGAAVTLLDNASIVVEEGGTLYLEGNAIELLGKDAVITMRGTLKTAPNVNFTFTGSGYASFYETHTLDLGIGSSFVIQRSSVNRFLELRENTNLYLDNNSLDLLNGEVHYWNNSSITALGQSVRFKGITAIAKESIGTSIGIWGLYNTLFEIEDSKFLGLLTGGRYIGATTVPIFDHNDVRVCKKGFRVESVKKVFFVENFISNFMETGIQVSNIEEAIFTDNHINGSGVESVGIEMNSIASAILDNTSVVGCKDVGVRAKESNVILKNGAGISNNDIGVLYHGNTSADWFLAVGKCHCSTIANNQIGVSGENIILEIDAEENQVSCNLPEVEANNFNDNDIVFDICYTDPNYIPPSAILMKGNYWGGGSISNYQYSITQNDCQVAINVDGSNFSNVSCYGDDGGGGTIGDVQVFGQQEEDKVAYSYYENGSPVAVHDIYRMAHTGFYNESLLNIPTSESTYLDYKSISTLNKTTHNDNKAIYKIDVSRCMVNAFDNMTVEEQANTNSPEEQDITEQPKAAQFKIYPNPATDRIWIRTSTDETYQISVYNVMGQRVDHQQFSSKIDLTVANWSEGIYLIEIRDEAGLFIKTERIVVQ